MATIADVSVAEDWKAAIPGDRLLAWYADDSVWHERVLLYPCGGAGSQHWVIATPDYQDPDGGGIYQ